MVIPQCIFIAFWLALLIKVFWLFHMIMVEPMLCCGLEFCRCVHVFVAERSGSFFSYSCRGVDHLS